MAQFVKRTFTCTPDSPTRLRACLGTLSTIRCTQGQRMGCGDLWYWHDVNECGRGYQN